MNARFIASVALIAISTPSHSAEPAIPVAPPPPSPLDPVLANRVAQAIVDDKLPSRSDDVSQNVFVGRTVKYPGSSDFEVEFQGAGLPSLIAQTEYIKKIVGNPKSVTCTAEEMFAFCKFNLPAPGRIMLASIMTRGGKVDHIQYIYLTREMVEQRSKGAR